MNQVAENHSDPTSVGKEIQPMVDVKITYDSYVAMRASAFRSCMTPARYLETIIAEGFSYRPVPGPDESKAPVPPIPRASAAP